MMRDVVDDDLDPALLGALDAERHKKTALEAELAVKDAAELQRLHDLREHVASLRLRHETLRVEVVETKAALSRLGEGKSAELSPLQRKLRTRHRLLRLLLLAAASAAPIIAAWAWRDEVIVLALAGVALASVLMLAGKADAEERLQ